MRHKSKNKTRPLFTLSLEMTRLVKETRLLLVPGALIRIYTVHRPVYTGILIQILIQIGCIYTEANWIPRI